jgi:hypothetical protein
MLNPSEITDPGFYWYLDAIGAPAQVVEVVGEPGDVLMVRFAGREDEDAVEDLSGTFVGPLRAPGSHQSLSEAEQKAVKTELAKTGGRTQTISKPPGEGHPS